MLYFASEPWPPSIAASTIRVKQRCLGGDRSSTHSWCLRRTPRRRVRSNYILVRDDSQDPSPRCARDALGCALGARGGHGCFAPSAHPGTPSFWAEVVPGVAVRSIITTTPCEPSSMNCTVNFLQLPSLAARLWHVRLTCCCCC